MFNTKQPRTLWQFTRGGEQEWRRTDLGFGTPFQDDHRGDFRAGLPRRADADVGGLFSPSALATSAGGFGCVTPDEAVASHRLFAAALRSQAEGKRGGGYAMKRSEAKRRLPAGRARSLRTAGGHCRPSLAGDITDFGLSDYWKLWARAWSTLCEEPEYGEKIMYAVRGQVTPAPLSQAQEGGHHLPARRAGGATVSVGEGRCAVSTASFRGFADQEGDHPDLRRARHARATGGRTSFWPESGRVPDR